MQEPDRWAILKAGDSYRVFAMWCGGYLDGDSWRINSGIERSERDGAFLVFHGASGSVYRCHEDGYGLTAYGASVLASLGESVDVLGSVEELPREFFDGCEQTENQTRE